MKQTFQSIQAQIAKLQAQADEARADEVAGVIARIKVAIDAYGLSEADLFGRGARAASKESVVARVAKYSDGNGNVWGGRGPRPLWLRQAIKQGKALEDFAVGSSTAKVAVAPTGKRAGGTRKAGRKAGRKGPVAIKYRDGSGNTWTGRGTKPRWLSAAIADGKRVEDFLVSA